MAAHWACSDLSVLKAISPALALTQGYQYTHACVRAGGRAGGGKKRPLSELQSEQERDAELM